MSPKTTTPKTPIHMNARTRVEFDWQQADSHWDVWTVDDGDPNSVFLPTVPQVFVGWLEKTRTYTRERYLSGRGGRPAIGWTTKLDRSATPRLQFVFTQTNEVVELGLYESPKAAKAAAIALLRERARETRRADL